jgi:hypothetical protein
MSSLLSRKSLYHSIKKTALFSLLLIVPLAITAAPPPGKGPGSGGGGGGGGSTVDHKAIQTLPISLGTSGGWEDDLANGYCCGGTLGSLIRLQDNSLHILSNFHVFASDVVAGGNGITAIVGAAPMIQPGLIDVSCNANNSQVVAVLSDVADPLSGANIDAAIAQIIPGSVNPDGSILEIGTLSADTLAASPGLNVKKSGRTSGLTNSTIDSLNASISITYEDECAGSSRGTARFTGQIVIKNKRGKFLKGGDSGSLLVEDIDIDPRAVGLLYAGSRTIAIANPIDDVLTYFGATMVGVSGSTTTSTSTQEPTTPSKGELSRAIATQKRVAKLLEAAPHGVGHGVGVNGQGRAVIKVFVETAPEKARTELPKTIDGISIQVVETGKIYAF